MSGTFKMLGFYPVPGLRIRYGPHRYGLTRGDIANLRTLMRIVQRAEYEAPRDPRWLIRYREQLRFVLGRLSAVPLAAVIERTRSADMRRLAIWLLGRHQGTRGTKAIAAAACDDQVVLRREVARALKRKHAWAQLRTLHECDPDERVRSLANQTSPEPHPGRLESFLGDVIRHETSGAEKPLRVLVDLDSKPGRPPKSADFIRRVLLSIQYLVRHHPLSVKKGNRP